MGGDESEKDNENESTTSFLTQLATWHKEELDEKLASRVQVSQRAVAKIIQVFDHMIQRNDKLFRAIHSEKGQTNETDAASSTAASATHEGKDNNIENDVTKEETDPSAKPVANHNIPSLDQQVKELNQQLQNENKALHHLNTSLHEKNHFLSLKQAEFQELINAEVTKNEELQNKHDDLDYEVTKCRMKITKLETGLIDAQESLKLYVDKDGGEKLEQKVVLSNAEKKSVEQLNQDLEEQRELASTRMIELEKTNENYKQALKEVEKLKMELSTLPEHVVVETTEHKCLQSQFSVLYNEAMQLKTQLEEARGQLQLVKNAHMRQIEQMESEELMTQKKLRTEVARYKRKCKESNLEINKLRKDLEEMKTAEIKALQVKKESAVNKHISSASNMAANNPNCSGSTTATSNEDVLNNASDSNSQDAEMSSPLHNHENNHSDNNVRSGNNGNSTEQTPEVTDETSNGPLKLKSEPSVDGDTELADPTGGVKEEPSEEMKFEAAAEVKTEQNSSGNVPISTTT